MFVVAGHMWDLISGSFISKTVEEVSLEVSALSSELWLESYGSLVGGTYLRSINADLRYNYKCLLNKLLITYFKLNSNFFYIT